MKKSFKKYFIPHEENEHKPYFLREKAVLAVTVFIIALLFASAAGSFIVKNNKYLAAIQSAFLVDLANEDRALEGAGQLVINDRLVAAAQLKANDMAEKGYFAHISPEGVTPWHWFGEANYKYIYAGENLAVNFNRSEDVEKAWMNSPLHRANILNSKYKEVGIATADGMYKGKSTTFVVQMFGSPISGVVKAEAITSQKEVEKPTPIQTPVEVVKTQAEIVDDFLNQETPNLNPNTGNRLAANTIPEVEGESVVAGQEDLLETEGDFIETQNPDYTLEIQENPSEEVVYTNWFERFLVNPGGVIDKTYVVLFVLILFSLILKIFISIRKQHPKNIVYGLLLLVLVLVFMYLNQEMFITPVIAST